LSLRGRLNRVRVGSGSGPIPVLFVIPSLDRGGAEGQLLALISRLDRTRFAPVLCSMHPPTPDRQREVSCPLVVLTVDSLFRWNAARATLRIARLASHLGVGLIHATFLRAELIATAATRLGPCIPVVLAKRNLDSRPYFWRERLLLRLAHRACDHIVANAEAVKQRVESLWNVSSDKISVIYNGVDLRSFVPASHETRAAAKRRLRIESDHTVVTILTHLTRIKGADLSVEVAARVASVVPRVTFLIVGGGPLLEPLRHRIRSLALDGRIRLEGEADHVIPYLAATDIGLLSSRSEGFPNAILEYIAMGLPTVATNVGGVSELVGENQECGFLVQPGNLEALANAIVTLASQPALREQTGLRARLRAERCFSVERMVEKYEELYLRLILDARGKPS
jgi:glycosyltransferase involved in cell wall biosynthesis